MMANVQLFHAVTIIRDTPKLAQVSLLVVFCLLAFAPACSAEGTKDPYVALYDVIMARKGLDGKTYGKDHAAPLLWNESCYLLDDDTYERFIEALDSFSALSQQEIVAYGDVKRALLQRHLWAVFDWATVRRPPTWDEPQALKTARFKIQGKVASLLKRLALSQAEIQALPNTIAATEKSGDYPTNHNPKDGFNPFFPAGLYDENGPWVCLRRTRHGLVAEVHSEFEEWRSAFHVFIRLPGGRAETLSYIDKLNRFSDPLIRTEHGFRLNPKTPQFPVGTQFALVERALLISDQGEPILSPLAYNVQMRAYLDDDSEDPRHSKQAFAEFVIQPRKLMDGNAVMKALGPDERHHTTFFSVDTFSMKGKLAHDPHIRLRSCMMCHGGEGILSVNSRSNTFRDSRHRHPLPVQFKVGNPNAIAESTAVAKKQNYTWGLLEGLWRNEAEQENARPIALQTIAAKKKSDKAPADGKTSKTEPARAVRGLSLAGIPSTPNTKVIAEIHEGPQYAPGKFAFKPNLFGMSVHADEGEPKVIYLAGKSRYYIQYNDCTYGPIAGNPMEKLKLTEILEKQVVAKGPKFTTSRLQEIMKHRDDTLLAAGYAIIPRLTKFDAIQIARLITEELKRRPDSPTAKAGRAALKHVEILAEAQRNLDRWRPLDYGRSWRRLSRND